MKVAVTLSKEELLEAVSEWYEKNHEIPPDWDPTLKIKTFQKHISGAGFVDLPNHDEPAILEWSE